jgi:hypothetical protein
MSPAASDWPPPRRKWRASLQDLLNEGLLQPGQEIRFARRDVHAQVTSKGTVLLNGTEYQSLSTAAKNVSGTSRNGWIAWGVLTKEDSWIPLAHLRKSLGQ